MRLLGDQSTHTQSSSWTHGCYGRIASLVLPTWPACLPLHLAGKLWRGVATLRHDDDDSWARHETCCHSHLAINAKITPGLCSDQTKTRRQQENRNKKKNKNKKQSRIIGKCAKRCPNAQANRRSDFMGS